VQPRAYGVHDMLNVVQVTRAITKQNPNHLNERKASSRAPSDSFCTPVKLKTMSSWMIHL
ncbi:hypothetical protein BpHYR1_008260, partial [Brachionus plicatilis]